MNAHSFKRLKANAISALGQNFFQNFDQAHAYEGILSVQICPDIKLDLKIGIFIGQKNEGVFPGSRVCALNESPWEHAILEAWRHWIIFENRKNDPNLNDLVYGRIHYFGTNGQAALGQIPGGAASRWPQAIIQLNKELTPSPSPFVLWRSLCADYRGWHEGTISRFVY